MEGEPLGRSKLGVGFWLRPHSFLEGQQAMKAQGFCELVAFLTHRILREGKAALAKKLGPPHTLQ